MDLEKVHDVLVSLALEAGELLVRSVRSREDVSVSEKASSVDLVTKVDLAAERVIVQGLKDAFGAADVLEDLATDGPRAEVVVIAEEAYSRSGRKRCLLDDRPTFICDPLDGTVNYVHLFPAVCIALGFCVEKVPVVGVTFAPFLSGAFGPSASGGVMWSSVRGRGAFQSHVRSSGSGPDPSSYTLAKLVDSGAIRLPLRRDPLPVDAPKGCLIAAEWGKDRRETDDSNLLRKLASLHNLASAVGTRGGKGGHAHGIRSLGSSALDMVMVASGSVDIMWEGGCWEWDVCAGIALLLEAGGHVVDANPPSSSSPLWDEDSPLPLAELGGRRYLAVRPCMGGRKEQERVMREVWRRVEPFTYARPADA